MKHSDYLKKKKTRETRKKIISVISAIVVFITTYALVLPAITLDVSKASQEPGIAYEQMQFKATAAAASVTAADSTVEEAQAEEPAAEEPEEEPAEEIKEEEPAETSEKEASAVSAEEEEEEEPAEEAPAEPEQEEAPAQEAPEVQEDKGEADSADEKSSGSAPAEAEAADTQKAAEDTAVDQSGTDTAEAAAAATTEAAPEFKVPELDALDFDEILTGKTNFYYYHVENAEEAEELSSDSIDDWKKVNSDTVLAPEDFVRVYLSYEIPAGALNETNAVARYTLPAGLELSDKQIKAVNKYENGIAASKSGSERDKYLGAEAIEGSRTPDQDADDEYIAATVKVKKTDSGRQELVFTFIPYTVEKNQISYDEKGEEKSKGKEVKGFFTFDLKTSQIDFEKTNIETVEKEDGTTEEIQYSEAKFVFADEDSNWIERALTLAAPVEKEEAREPKTLTREGADYTVIVSYTDEAQIPDNAELTVREIEKETEEYESYLEQAKGAVENTKSVNEARFFDITIVADGEKVEPQAPVSVQINFAGIEQTNTDDTQLLHYKDSEDVEVMDKAEFSKSEEQAVDTVQFETNGFSVYGIVGTETITTEHIDHNGTNYEVTVTYGPEAKIPDGSTLSVTDIEEGTEEYEHARNAVLADKQAKGEEVFLPEFGFAALDISVLNPAGEEIEPSAPVQVDIKIKSLPNVENLDDVVDSIEIQHHVETGDKVVVDTVYDGGATEAKFDVVTNEEAIAEGTAVDPNSVNPEDYNPKDINLPESVDVSFETGAFSTYSISWGSRSYNIHYVDTNGNSLTPTITPSYTNSDRFLIYDIEGYEYDSTHLSSRTGTTIRPYVENYNNDRIYQTTEGNWYYLRDDIYVVYKAKSAPTQGGTPQVDQDETWPEGNDAPQFSKSSTNNGNGTNTVSLSIKAAEKPVEKSTPADVIVVFDVSGSMDENLSGGTKRLAAAKSAVNTMANTLLNGSNTDVRMALISFSTDATEVQGFTSNYTTFSGKVNGLSADGGTNWEKALILANKMEVRSDAATFVVFVTDGDPTFRVSRGNVSDGDLDMFYSSQNEIYTYYMSNNVFGEGYEDSDGRNFDFAVDQVSAIAGANKSFYAIGISNDVKKVQNLTTQGGVDADHAFIASNTTAMNNAFKSITEAIKATLGFGAVEITDGITDLTSTRMEMLHSVDANSFKYYRYGGEGNKYGADAAHKTEWTTREADGCGPASYDETTGAVEWNMGDTFQLEDGVTYVVEFTAWPSQDAYDLVADLNNGIKAYDGLTPEQKAQVVKLNTDPVTYALKTNTDNVNATYKKTTEAGGTVTISDTHPVDADYTPGTIQNMGLQSMKLTVQKVFEDDLTAGEDRDDQVTLVLKRRDAHQSPEAAFADYAVPQGGTTSANIVLNQGNDWKYELYVAPGFEVDGEVLEHGYDFTITEPGIDYHYGLIEEIINPMVVNGQEKYYGDGELINGETITEYTDRSLTAVNRVKSGVDVKKSLVDQNGNPISSNVEFTIKGKLLGPDGKPYTWKDGDDVNASGAYHKYDANGNRIVYKGHFADSSNIEFTLKAGEYVRFINVPDGCTFEFDEDKSSMLAGYEWKSTTAVTQHKISADGDFTQEGDVQPVVPPGSSKAELTTGVVGNKQYSITFTNTVVYVSKDLVIKKTDDKGADLTGAKFELSMKSGSWNKVTDLEGADTNGYITIGTQTISNKILPDTVYKLTEKSSPDGYIILDSSVYFKVHNGTILLTDENGEQLKDEDGNPIDDDGHAKVTNGDQLIVSIKNTPGQSLPNTGGCGTLPYTLSGLMLLIVSALMYGFRMRRRERRLN